MKKTGCFKGISVKFAAGIMAAALILCGCQKEAEVSEETAATEPEGKVSLVFWEATEEGSPQLAMMEEMAEAFKAQHSDVSFDITIEPVGSDCKDRIISDMDNAPDVFTFADDQLMTLVAAGIVGPVEKADEIRARNLPAAVEAATVQDKLYAYPLTADNGYFLFYDKSVFDENDIKTMDGLVKKAAAVGKKVSFDVDNGWYLYSFFGNTGLKLGLNDDGITNFCTWNDEGGKDVCKAIEQLAKADGFVNAGDDELMQGAKDGTIAAGVSGVWVASALKEAWKDKLAAAKLPTYTVKGKQVQMASYAGYRLVGVNRLSPHADWAAKFADFVTSEENQTMRFEKCGQGPSNVKAAGSEQVKKSIALQALIDQSEYSSLQRIGNAYWGPAASLGEALVKGTSNIAQILDDTVKEITALPSD